MPKPIPYRVSYRSFVLLLIVSFTIFEFTDTSVDEQRYSVFSFVTKFSKSEKFDASLWWIEREMDPLTNFIVFRPLNSTFSHKTSSFESSLVQNGSGV
jgi:hypothetical protein